MPWAGDWVEATGELSVVQHEGCTCTPVPLAGFPITGCLGMQVPARHHQRSTAALGVMRCSPVPLPFSVGSQPQNCPSGWLQGPKQSRYEGEGSPFSAWFAVGNPSPPELQSPTRATGWVLQLGESRHPPKEG